MPKVLSEIQGMITARTGLLSPKRISGPRKPEVSGPLRHMLFCGSPATSTTGCVRHLSGCSAAGEVL